MTKKERPWHESLSNPPLVKDQVLDSLIRIKQDPQMLQSGGLSGNKALQINVQIVGDSAIDRAQAQRADILTAIRCVLERLPEPKMEWLKMLAVAAFYDEEMKWGPVAERLGWSYRNLQRKDIRAKVMQILEGEIVDLVEQDPPEIEGDCKTVCVDKHGQEYKGDFDGNRRRRINRPQSRLQWMPEK